MTLFLGFAPSFLQTLIVSPDNLSCQFGWADKVAERAWTLLSRKSVVCCTNIQVD